MDKEIFFFRQLFRFGVVGIASNFLGYCLYILITYFGAEHKSTMTFLYLTGAIIGYIGNKTWSFEYQGRTLSSAARYCIAHFAGFLLNLAILLYFVDSLGYAHQLVQAIAIFVVAGFLFVTFRLYVFRPHYSTRDSS